MPLPTPRPLNETLEGVRVFLRPVVTVVSLVLVCEETSIVGVMGADGIVCVCTS